jgi:2-phospho-L-lactate guanylyltransferase (CobY/MobA/RfbA family)
MASRQPSATLLVFTLGAEADCGRHPLLPNRHRSAEIGLRQACLEGILTAGRESGCELEVCAPHPLALPADARSMRQSGASFGARLGNALSRALGRGSGPVVVAGTDVPGLDANHITEALRLLDQDAERVVLGPCPDGGIYLLAAARPLGDALAQVAWCRSSTLADVLAALEAAGRPVVLLAALSDLDRPSDLERWLAGRIPPVEFWQPILAGLRRLLALLRRPPSPTHLGRVRPAVSPVPVGRSPPLPLRPLSAAV